MRETHSLSMKWRLIVWGQESMSGCLSAVAVLLVKFREASSVLSMQQSLQLSTLSVWITACSTASGTNIASKSLFPVLLAAALHCVSNLESSYGSPYSCGSPNSVVARLG